MKSLTIHNYNKPHWVTRAGLWFALLFLYLPIGLIFLYGFSTDETTYQFPLPGFTLKWFHIAFFERPDIIAAISLSVQVALIATAFALVFGTLTAMALARHNFIGKNILSLWLLLPIALPGIITGMALRASFYTFDIPYSFWTLVLGHATFCMVVVHNNAIARLRRLSPNMVEASLDLGANYWQSFRYIVLPNLGTALLAGGMLSFALSFDEVIVTTFTAGQQTTLPIWMLDQLLRPRQRPVTNIVAMMIVLITFIPILISYRLTREEK